ncbi:hypothetical protein [Parasphingorhabdus sp.]|uniref:hypothetical protein n=1 Tax=Parasphingorhabdus sp. TaxID=2709688 RepID=UPI00300177A4
MLATVSDSAVAVGCSIGHWIYNFQTLITGAAAIVAAWYVGAPVWQQLKDNRLQTQIMHRETLAVRLREAEERAARVATAIDEPLLQAQRLTSYPQGEPREVGPHDAFEMMRILEGLLDWYLITLRGTEDASIESAKSELSEALDGLSRTLNSVHWPDHNDQSGDDYCLTDEEWAEVLRKADEGKTLAAKKVNEAWKANRALKAAQQTGTNELRQQIARLDQTIAQTS